MVRPPSRARACALLALVGLAACNALSGVDDLLFGPTPAGSVAASGGAGAGSGGEGGAVSCRPGDTVTCYDGPPGTEGVAACAPGTRTCSAAGVLGDCVGQHTPQPDDCVTPADEDCDGATPACSGTLLWSKAFGDGGRQHAWRLVVDGAGDVLVTGGFEGTIDFGAGIELTSAGAQDVFVVKLSGDGEPIWAKGFGGGADDIGIDIALDTRGDILLTGVYGGAMDFGGGPLTAFGGEDLFVAKLDPVGGHLWSSGFGDAAQQEGRGIGVDAMGNVYVTGQHAGVVAYGGLPLASQGAEDVLALRFDADGSYVWGQLFGAGDGEKSFDAAVNAAGQLAIGGVFVGNIDFGSGAITGSGDTDLFVSALDPSGASLWAVGAGNGNGNVQETIGVDIDAAGNVVATGFFEGNIFDKPAKLYAVAASDFFVAKFDPEGKILWTRSVGDAGVQGGLGVAFDPFGHVVVGGELEGSFTFGASAITATGTDNSWVGKLDASGTPLWARRLTWNGPGDQASGIGTDALGNVFVAGAFESSLDTPAGEVKSAGGADVFIAKLAP